MTTAQRKVPAQMTLDEFLAWTGDGTDTKYQLVDGAVRAMAPASTTHGTIQARLIRFIDAHLDVPGNRCRVVTAPGVDVRLNANMNYRIPDIGVGCTPDGAGEGELPDPILLIELMSPSNKPDTMANVWAYTTIPSVREILIVQTTRIEADLLRRQTDGSWPPQAERIGADGTVDFRSIDLSRPLRDFYVKTYLVPNT